MTTVPSSKDRLEFLSDGVFAIAITLLVIEIRAPEDTRDLVRKLLELWPSYLAYIISFLLIGLIWANHHAMFERIRAADRALMFINILLLMSVAFLPFVAAVLAASFRTGEGQRTAVTLYGTTLVVGGLFFNGIWQYVQRHTPLLAAGTDPAEVRRLNRRFLLGPALYAAATLVGVALPALGVASFALLILFYWLPPLTHRQRRPPGSNVGGT